MTKFAIPLDFIFILFGTHHVHRITHESLRLISSIVHDDVWSLRVGGGVHDKLHISSAGW